MGRENDPKAQKEVTRLSDTHPGTILVTLINCIVILIYSEDFAWTIAHCCVL